MSRSVPEAPTRKIKKKTSRGYKVATREYTDRAAIYQQVKSLLIKLALQDIRRRMLSFIFIF